MDHADHLTAHAALAKALDAYEEWLDGQLTPGVGRADASGASLLHAIAEIRRHHCPGATQLMTSLLLDHTNLSSILFEYQLKFVRGQAKAPLSRSLEFAVIVKRQRDTLSAMRSACANGRSNCLFATSAKKGTRIPTRPAVQVADTRPSPI